MGLSCELLASLVKRKLDYLIHIIVLKGYRKFILNLMLIKLISIFTFILLFLAWTSSAIKKFLLYSSVYSFA